MSFTPGRPLGEAATELITGSTTTSRTGRGSTIIGEKVVDLLVKRHGVCQDFSHVMVGGAALARAWPGATSAATSPPARRPAGRGWSAPTPATPGSGSGCPAPAAAPRPHERPAHRRLARHRGLGPRLRRRPARARGSSSPSPDSAMKVSVDMAPEGCPPSLETGHRSGAAADPRSGTGCGQRVGEVRWIVVRRPVAGGVAPSEQHDARRPTGRLVGRRRGRSARRRTTAIRVRTPLPGYARAAGGADADRAGEPRATGTPATARATCPIGTCRSVGSR